MKFSATLFAVMALTASQAAGAPSAEPEAHRRHGRIGFCGAPGTPCLVGRDANDPQGDAAGYCGAPGSACYTVKRTAHAIANALAQARAADSEGTFCGVPGAPCEKTKKHIDEIADKAKDSYTRVYEREADAEAEADPEARRHGRIGFCGAPGTPCLVGRSADPEAEARRHGRIGFCGAPGTPCLVGRDAMPHARGRIGFCGAPGTPCLVGRNAEAIAAARRHGRIGFCGAPGTPCLVGRDAEAAPAPAAEAEARRHGRIGFCGAPGTPCLVGRDAEAIGKIINNADPTYLKKECFKEGNECHTLLKVHQVFQTIKREADEEKNVTDPWTKLAHCGKKDANCGPLTQAHQYAAKHNEKAAEVAENECRSSKGACTLAQRDLDDLESSINDAVASLHDE